MAERSLPVRFSFLTPGTWNPMPVAVSAQGICTQPLHLAACSGVSGASEAPKSTVRAVIWAIPAPEPTDPYLTAMPSLISKPLIQLAIRGATSEDPAPVSPAAQALAAPVAMTQTAVKATPSNLIRFKRIPFDSIRCVSLAGARVRPGDGTAWADGIAHMFQSCERDRYELVTMCFETCYEFVSQL